MKRALPLVMLCVFISACATAPVGDRLMKGADEQWVYGTGVGKTEAIARRGALRDLSHRILGHFKETARAVTRVENGVAQTRSETVFYSVSNVELESAQVDAVTRNGGVINVRVRIPTNTLRALVARNKRKAATMSLVSQIESSPKLTASTVIRLALAGLEHALDDGVLKERVKVKGRGIETFQQYFQFVIRQKLASLRVLVTPSDASKDRFTVTLIETPSLMYQANMPLRLAALTKTTNGAGVATLLMNEITQQSETAVAIDFDIRRLLQHQLLTKNDLIIDALMPPPKNNTSMTRVYLHTQHQNTTTAVVVRVVNSERYANVTTPSQIWLQPGYDYVLQVIDSESNKAMTKTIRIPLGAAEFYISLPVEKKQYGQVDILVADARSIITLTGPGRQVREEGQIKNRRTETGQYQISVKREDKADYQTIVDTVTVLPNKALARRYRAPRDRERYQYGHQIGLSLLRVGRKLKNNYTLPGNTAYADFQSDYDLSLKDCDGPALSGQYLSNTAHLMLQGQAGILWCNSGAGLSSSVSAEIIGAGIGIGVYKKMNDHLFWLSAGVNNESISWDQQKSKNTSLSTGSASNTFRYLELGALIGPFQMRLMIPADKLAPMASFGIGMHHLKSGYRYPAITSSFF